MKEEKTHAIRENRVWAACALIGIALSFVAIKVIDWNDCATHAANIGTPTTFTLDRGCLVLSSSGAYAAGRYDDYERNHPTLASGFIILGFFSLVMGASFVPRAIGDFIAERKVKAENEKLAKSLKQGLSFHEPGRIIAVMREVQDVPYHKQRYQLKQIDMMFLVYPDEPKFDEAKLPDEEFGTIEDTRERWRKSPHWKDGSQ